MSTMIDDFVRRDDLNGSVGIAHHRGELLRFRVCNSTGYITKLEKHVGDDEWELIDDEPPLALRVLVRHRLAGFC